MKRGIWFEKVPNALGFGVLFSFDYFTGVSIVILDIVINIGRKVEAPKKEDLWRKACQHVMNDLPEKWSDKIVDGKLTCELRQHTLDGIASACYSEQI